MSLIDWFKKAKDAKKKAKQDEESGEKNKYGNMGSQSKAYADAAAALDEEEAREKQ